MPRATCRCGQVLSVPVVGPERVVCPRCSAKVRVRRDAPRDGAGDGDGFIRFNCPCGRRLKVRAGDADGAVLSGKCPECGRVVPVPTSSSGGDLRLKGGGAESPTDELDADDLAVLDRWSEGHLGTESPAPASASEAEAEETLDPSRAPTGALPVSAGPSAKAEAGLRVCSRCGRPLHLSAVACRDCGAPAPRR